MAADVSQEELLARQMIARKLGGALFAPVEMSRAWNRRIDPGALLSQARAKVIGVPFYAYGRDGYKRAYAVVRCQRCSRGVLVGVKKLSRKDSGAACGCNEPSQTMTRLYGIWRNIKARCRNKNNRDYARYGAKGIDICAEWAGNFMAFKAWADAHGYDKSLTLDRKSNELGYHPDNCRWVSWKQQANNRRNTVTLTAFGVTKALGDWAADPRCRVSRDVLYGRARRQAMTPEEMITRPVRVE